MMSGICELGGRTSRSVQFTFPKTQPFHFHLLTTSCSHCYLPNCHCFPNIHLNCLLTIPTVHMLLFLVLGLVACIVHAIPTITAKGSKFFTSDGNQFFLKGMLSSAACHNYALN